MSDPTDPGDGKNLCAIRTMQQVWADDRGLHLGFWDLAPDQNPDELSIADARYIISFNPHNMDKFVGSLMQLVHQTLDAGYAWNHPIGVPAPFPPMLRHDLAGLPHDSKAGDPVPGKPEDMEGGFHNPEGFDSEAWNKRLGLD